MNDEEFEEICNRIDKEALRSKDSQSAIFKIFEVYKKLSEYEKVNVNNVIIKWLWDENKRYDALMLIDEFLIKLVIPELYKLKEKLETENKASAIYDIKKIDNILKSLV